MAKRRLLLVPNPCRNERVCWTTSIERRRWPAEEIANSRIRHQGQRRPADLHAEEQPHLIPLPSRSYDAAETQLAEDKSAGYQQGRRTIK